MTRWEWLTLGIFAALVYAWCAPRIQVLIWRSERAEVGYLLESMQLHAMTHGMPSFGPTPRGPGEVGVARVPWTGGPKGWTSPTATARGSYFTEGGRFVGVCDVDGDGVPARYTATVHGPIVRETPEDVY